MLISAKFASRCGGCGGTVEVGELISWQRGNRVVFHAGCSSEGREAAKAQQASRATDAEVDLVAPNGLEYLPFQRAGIAYAMARPGVLFGDEMGLGKTVQVLGVINNVPEIKRVLVVCPKSLINNWKREAFKWLVRPMHIGTNPFAFDFAVMSYDELRAQKDDFFEQLDLDLLVVDEAQYVKNYKAKRSVAVAKARKRARRVHLLTGTPIPNKITEIYPILAMADPNTWDPKGGGKGFWSFAIRYAGAVKGKWGWELNGTSNLQEFQLKARASCMVRRLKRDVLKELPPKRRQVIELPNSAASTSAVNAENERSLDLESNLEELRVRMELARAEDQEVFAAAVRDLGAAFRVSFAEIAKERHRVAMAKAPIAAEYARSLLEDNEGEKLIVFAHHHDVIDLLRSELGEFGAVSIDGRDDVNLRQERVDRFQSDPTCRVFVGGLTAAGTGLTLTAASTVLMVEMDWVPATMSQAEDRAHRIGQDQSVLVQYLALENSLDARMAAILVEKMDVADRALDATVLSEPVIPVKQIPATRGTASELKAIADTLSAADIRQIHGALRALAGMCDGANRIDSAGFSRIDVRVGHSLANSSSLSPKQAALGMRLCKKYRRQVGEGCWSN